MASEAWKAFHSCDDPLGDRNMLGKLMFGSRISGASSSPPTSRTTRFTADGKVPVPLRGMDSFISHATALWNQSRELREAASMNMATNAALNLMKDLDPD